MTTPQPSAPGGLPGPSGQLPDAHPPSGLPGPGRDRGLPESPGEPGHSGRGAPGAEPRPELPQPERPGDGPQPARPGEHEPPGEYAQPGEQRPGEAPDRRPPHQQAPPPPGSDGSSGPGLGERPAPDVTKQGSEGDEAPEQVRNSRTLWLFTAVGLVVSQLASLLPGSYRRPLQDYREMLGSMAEQFSDEQLQQSIVIAQWLSVALVAVAAALIVLVAGQLLKGRNWARALLTAGGVVLVANGLSALLVLLSGGAGAPSAAPVPQFVALAATMLAGLFCAVAIWQMYTEPAKKFFLERNGVPPRR